MRERLLLFSRRYQAALRKYVLAEPGVSLPDPTILGLQAVALRLETLALARVHDQAITALALKRQKGKMHAADAFFARAVIPIEIAHDERKEGNGRLLGIRRTLRQRTRHLAACNRRLKRGIVHRQTMERSLKENGGQYLRLLKESRQAQLRLRQLARRRIWTQELERGKISRALHHEIGQVLVGINVQLVNLKKKAAVDSQTLTAYIRKTQRLIDRSTQAMHRFAGNFGKRNGN